MRKDFQPAFGDHPVHRVKGGINTSREIYFASYQAMTGPGDVDALFGDYAEDFFDLVIVDECHRGSAAQDSAWRRVLDISPARSSSA
jgi:type I restriction enzyme, R subunit